MLKNNIFYNHQNIYKNLKYLKKTQPKILKNRNFDKYTINKYNEYLQVIENMNNWLYRLYKSSNDIINFINILEHNLNLYQNENKKLIDKINGKKCVGSICSFDIDYDKSTDDFYNIQEEQYLCELCKTQ